MGESRLDCGVGVREAAGVFRRFGPYYRHLREVKLPFFCGVTAGLVYAAASGLGLPLVVKVVLPVLFREEGVEDKWYVKMMQERLQGVEWETLLWVTCMWIPVMFGIRAVGGYMNAYLIQYSGLRVVERIRTDVFVKLQHLPLAFFHRNRSGDLLARLMADSEILRQVVAQASSDLIKQPATLLFALGYLTWEAASNRSVAVALIALMSVPLCVGVIRVAGKKLAARAKKLQQQGGDLTALLAESLSSPLEIRAYNLQERQIEHFRARVRTILKLMMKVVKYRQAISPSIEFVAATGFAFALYIGASQGMSLKDFMALGMALYMAYEPVKKLGNIHSLLKQGESAVERIEHILHEPDTLPEPAEPVVLGELREGLGFEKVGFAYGEERVLKGIDLKVKMGEVVALVGPSGAGKTTFVQLIPRLYDPTEGRVTLDGVDLRQISKAALRARIAVVPQMPALFSGTIRENIRLGRPEATDEEVAEAARRAHAEEFILAQPAGYEAEVGERGLALSGGQRQRIAIARAFLKDAPILILDEATSALDSESEAKVQEALAQLVKGRTTFLIAHRFSTIAVADRILLFQGGEVVADGTHEEVYASNALYRTMYDRQSL